MLSHLSLSLSQFISLTLTVTCPEHHVEDRGATQSDPIFFCSLHQNLCGMKAEQGTVGDSGVYQGMVVCIGYSCSLHQNLQRAQWVMVYIMNGVYRVQQGMVVCIGYSRV